MFERLFGSGKKKPAEEPATEKQKKFAGKLGVKNADSLSKEEASEQIDKKLAARSRRDKGLLSHLEGRIEALEKAVAKKPAKMKRSSRRTGIMTNYYRIILGKRHASAEQCVEQGFVGIDYNMPNLADKFPSDEDGFYQKLEGMYQADHPDASKVQVSLACGVITKFVHRIQEGDFVICPMGDSSYRVGEVVGGYFYVPDGVLPHRRKVRWFPQVLQRSSMSDGLRGSLGGALTIIGPDSITRHREEIDRLLGGGAPPVVTTTDPDVEDPVAFAMEKHLEDFLVRNWQQTTLSSQFEILSEGEEFIGQQFPTDVGPIDILAVSKDKSRLLVIELKRGRVSDVVVGQLARYMGFVKGKVAEPHQTVEGLVIALQNDNKLKWALSALPNVRFLRYQINFNLIEE